MESEIFKRLISPETGLPLRHINDKLITEDGNEIFQIHNGIALLLRQDNLNKAKIHERDVFDRLPIQDVAYFRAILFHEIISKVNFIFKKNHTNCQKDLFAVEMGGGEGHWARYFKKDVPYATVFVCDLSMKTLERAPTDLKRVCADITRQIFEKKSIRLASFWVSLHHLGAEDRKNALKEVADALEEGGALLIFEPNKLFLPRKILYRTRLSKDVYFDEKEQAIDFLEVSSIIKNSGLVEVGTCFINPPYNAEFIKKLKRWFIYMLAVEFLYQIDRWVLSPILGGIFYARQSQLKKYLSLYGLAIYRKERI